MGEQRRWVVSVDEETHRLAEQWQADFSPLVGNNRSSLVRLVFKTLDRLGFTAATLTAALHQPQQLRQANAEQNVAQLNNLSHIPVPSKAGLMKPPSRVRTGSARGREVHGVTRRVALAMEASGITFFPLQLRSNSTRRNAA